MELKCKRETCQHVWDYKGKNKFYACCPKCKSSIRIVCADDGKKESR